MNKPNLSLIPLFLFAASAAATTRYVVPPGTPGVATAPGYTSWGTAATNIQHAIDAAATDDLILVTNGTYRLTSEISIAKKITLRSFKDGTTDRDGTILDGNFPATSNRCINVNFDGAVVDGFTITNGYAVTGHVLNKFGGGGVKIEKGTVTNCLITGNWTPLNGGGASVFTGGLLVDCTVSRNAATNATASDGGYGGGIVMNGGTLRKCVIANNRSGYQGGGLWMYTSGGTVEDCTIANNHAQPLPGVAGGSGYGGGIWSGWGGTIARCTIVSNTVGFSTSGSNLGGAGASPGDGMTVRDSLIAYNTAIGGGYGGGANVGNRRTVINCVIRNNSAAMGGGVFPGGTGLVVDCTIVSNSSAAFVQGGVMRNCLFAYNASGIWNYNGSPGTYQNCTIANNGGVGIRFSIPGHVENTIVYDNNSAGVNWSYDGTGSGSTWTNSCTYPMPTGASVVGMETNAPRFMNAALGDFSLRGSSPCIDKGVYRTWMASAKDRAGNPRIIGAAVDMGAFEAPLPPGTAIVVR